MRDPRGARFGQDLVFTVPVLEAAVDHAVDTLQPAGHGGWEGRFVVVVGPAPVIDPGPRPPHRPAEGAAARGRLRG